MGNLKSVVVKRITKEAQIKKKAEEIESIKTPIKRATIMDDELILSSLYQVIGALTTLGEPINGISFIPDSMKSYLEWSLDITKAGEDGFYIKINVIDLKLVGTIEIDFEDKQTEPIVEDGVELKPLNLEKIEIEMDSSKIAMGSGTQIILQDVDVFKGGEIKLIFK